MEEADVRCASPPQGLVMITKHASPITLIIPQTHQIPTRASLNPAEAHTGGLENK